MTREEHIFRIGRVDIDGESIAFEPERELTFQAGRRDAVMVGIQYSYREASEDKEEVRIRLTAHVEGQQSQSEEAVIRDNPVLDDSRRGFLSVPVQVRGPGPLRGRFVVEARYGAGPWRKPAEVEVEERSEGVFTLHVQ